MLDPNTVIDAIVSTLQTNDALVALLANADPNSIFGYRFGEPGPADNGRVSMNFEQQVQEQPEGTIMVAWRGTRTGTFAKLEATKHDMACYLKPTGLVGEWFSTLVDSLCTSTGVSFRLSTIHPKLNPPEQISLIPQTTFIGQGYALYDMMPVTFTLTERGLDTPYSP